MTSSVRADSTMTVAMERFVAMFEKACVEANTKKIHQLAKKNVGN